MQYTQTHLLFLAYLGSFLKISSVSSFELSSTYHQTNDELHKCIHTPFQIQISYISIFGFLFHIISQFFVIIVVNLMHVACIQRHFIQHLFEDIVSSFFGCHGKGKLTIYASSFDHTHSKYTSNIIIIIDRRHRNCRKV